MQHEFNNDGPFVPSSGSLPAAASAPSESPNSNQTTAQARERTFILVKPDGVHRGLVGEIIKRFEQRGYKIVAIKTVQASKEHLSKHYSAVAGKPFFNGLVSYMSSGPVVPMAWEGREVVKIGREMLGETNPLKSSPGSIRGDFCIDIGRNICHGSESIESAQREISLWFNDDELVNYTKSSEDWVYE